MRRPTQVVYSACLALGVTLMMSSTAQAQQVVVLGSGSGAFDVPGVANGAVAFAKCTIDRTVQTIDCSSNVYNILDLTAGHVHVGGPGTSGPVIIAIPSLPLRISGTFGQSWTWTPANFTPNPASGINTMDDLINACAGGNCYLNWHTTLSPGGALRVNLCPQSRAANTINGIAVCTSVQPGDLPGAAK